MGEEVTQSDVVLENSAGDETDKASTEPSDECDGKNLIEKCEAKETNLDGSVPQPQAEKSPRKSSLKPQENSFEKSKKWYNISFMQRAHNSRSTNTSDNKSATKMDNRHSWHLNDSMEM